MPSSAPNIKYWSLVSGFIQDVAQWIFKGHPLKTFEKHAPICTLGVGGRPLLIGFGTSFFSFLERFVPLCSLCCTDPSRSPLSWKELTPLPKTAGFCGGSLGGGGLGGTWDGFAGLPDEGHLLIVP